jgi:hypothetical protein
LERWLHHSQIRRALGLGSLAEEPFLTVGVELVAAAVVLEPGIPPAPYGAWALGPVALGRAQRRLTSSPAPTAPPSCEHS